MTLPVVVSRLAAPRLTARRALVRQWLVQAGTFAVASLSLACSGATPAASHTARTVIESHQARSSGRVVESRPVALEVEADASLTASASAEPPDADLPGAEPPGADLPGAEPAPPAAPEVAPWDRAVTLAPEVEARVRAIAASRPSRHTDVFIKVGDSATVNRAFMRCFAADDELDLGGRDELRETIEAVRAARVSGGTSFGRESEAAGVGWSVARALRGSPSPIASEVRALSPRFALVMFGGNDLEMGRLGRYEERMASLVSRLTNWGVVPILSTISRRNDDPEADAEVPRYNAAIRALAEAEHLPLVDLEEALDPLPRHGLASDGVHPNAPVRDGRARGCDFSDTGLAHGQNARNMLNLRMLDHLRGLLTEQG